MALVTTPEAKTARRIARSLVDQHLAACVNIVPGLESHYWWEGKVAKSRELLLLIKTSGRKLAQVEAAVLKLHPYDTPEFMVIPFSQGNERYLKWLETSLMAAREGSD